MKVAIIRGAYLNEWELESLPGDADVSVQYFCAYRNTFPLGPVLSSRVHKLPTISLQGQHGFRRLVHGAWARTVRRFLGDSQVLIGLGSRLSGYDVAHVAELRSYYSLQAVRA